MFQRTVKDRKDLDLKISYLQILSTAVNSATLHCDGGKDEKL